MTALAPVTAIGNVKIDYEAVLKTLKLNPADPNTQALLVTCNSYELDPVLKHMVLIQGAPYVTHKGLWHIAHRSGLLDGHEILEEGEDGKEYFARVAIYRKDWTRPVTMKGRYPKSGTNKQYGQEMAVTRAECLVLRRLFDVALPVYEEINWRDRPARADENTSDNRGVPVAPSGNGGEPSSQRSLSAGAPQTSSGEDARPQPQAASASSPVEIVTTSPPTSARRTFAPPKKVEADDVEPMTLREAQQTASRMRQQATKEAPLVEGVQPALMTALRDTLTRITNDSVRKELVAKWSEAGLPNVKAESVVLTEAQYEVALVLAQDAEESQAELEKPFDEPTLLDEDGAA